MTAGPTDEPTGEMDPSVDLVALVEAELARDPTLPASLKAAILERARTLRVRQVPRAS